MADDDDKGGYNRPDDDAVILSLEGRRPFDDRGQPGKNALRRASRITQAWRFRVAGMSWQEVARQTGYSNGAACKAALLRAAERVESETVEEFRELENERLDRLQAAIWPKALGGDIPSVQVALRLMERRARLNGLDRPVQVQINPTGSDVLAWVQDFLTAQGVAPEADVVEADVVDVEWTEGEDGDDTDGE